MTSQRVLVTGGVRSGKSRHAESLVGSLVGSAAVTYLAAGSRVEGDPEWAARVAAHRLRRPPAWTTVEGTEVAAALREAPGPVLLDSLGSWVAAVCDEAGLWVAPPGEHAAAERVVLDRFDALVAAWADRTDLSVAVTNEVGWGLVSEHRSGRVFCDLLGRLNQAVAAVSDEVVLVVAGRTLRL